MAHSPGGRNSGLDAARAIGALAVFLQHAGLTSRTGGFGVDAFFVLSALVLYRPFLSGKVVVRRYAVRRIVRIFPAYWAAVIVLATLLGGWALVIANPLGYVTTARQFEATSFIAPAWSLPFELAFYLALPALAVLARGGPQRLLGLLVATVTLTVAGLAVGLPSYIDSTIAFPVGMLLAFVSRPIRLPLGLLALACVAVGEVLPTGNDAALLVGASLFVAWAINVRAPHWLASAGRTLSYPFYLYHAGMLRIAPWPLAGPLAVGLAALSYVGVERPSQRAIQGMSVERAAVAQGLAAPGLEP